MSDAGGDRTEKPTGKRLSEAQSKGQFAKTVEIQTVFILAAGFIAVSMSAHKMLNVFTSSMIETIGQLGKLPLSTTSVHTYFMAFAQWTAICVLPVAVSAFVAAILAGGLQSRFHLSTSKLELKWERINPVSHMQQLFQPVPSLMRTVVGVLKLIVILGLTYVVIKRLMNHPIFYSSTSFGDVLLFMAESMKSITARVLLGLGIIAAADYGYQLWKHQKDLMMTKQEVKDESKNAEGNPQVKSELRRRRLALLKQTWMRELPKADVIVTNPTHLSVALRYDRKTMRAPKIVAKGARLNALRIREIAKQYQIPIVENKPVAQLLFKHCKIGQEVPPEVYTAIAEILAYVYRVNRFRYHTEGQQIPA